MLHEVLELKEVVCVFTHCWLMPSEAFMDAKTLLSDCKLASIVALLIENDRKIIMPWSSYGDHPAPVWPIRRALGRRAVSNEYDPKIALPDYGNSRAFSAIHTLCVYFL